MRPLSTKVIKTIVQKSQENVKKHKYHDSNFGTDEAYDDLTEELTVTTSAVAQMIPSQQRDIVVQSFDKIMERYENAKRNLATPIDDDDIIFISV